MRVHIVSDDQELSTELGAGLASRGYEVQADGDIGTALELCHDVDALLIDLVLSDVDGFEVCRAVRAVSHVPIIVTSARDDEFDRILSFKLGADDYVQRPYSLRELTARIEAVVRRAGNFWGQWEAVAASAAQVRELGPVRIDLHQRVVTVGRRDVSLTRKEFDVLALLASEPGRVYGRENIMVEVWGHDGAGDTRTLGVHITSLRKKLGVPTLIETVRGVGFRLAAPRVNAFACE